MRAFRLAMVLTAALAGVLALGTGQAGAAGPYPVPWTIAAGSQARGPDDSPPGSNDFTCKPSAAHPNPVVLVHGLGANMAENWQTMSPLLANQGYCVFALTYGRKPDNPQPFDKMGGVVPMERSSQELSSFVDRVLAATGAAKVDIVGHSEGSLMPNYYVKFLGGAAKVDHYVGMTPLWNGTNLAGLATLDQIGRANGGSSPSQSMIDGYCGSCREFLTGSDFMKKMQSGGVAAPGVTYTMVMTRNDELVSPYTSGYMRAPNATNLVVQDQCRLDQAEHVSVAADPIVARDILNALDPAHSRPPQCVPVLPFVGAPTFKGSEP
jgi:triacylglycerol lipase